MTYEVERKYRIDDAAKLVDQVRALGGEFGPSQRQVDTYYAHPARDFMKTDEALRIRRVGQESFLTYKGPKIDAASKTRLEIEVPLAGGMAGAAAHARLLAALAFREAIEVKKSRRQARLSWEGREVDVALDDVDSLGLFVEIEMAADDESLESAKLSLASLAERLDLGEGERRAYADLLLDRALAGS